MKISFQSKTIISKQRRCGANNKGEPRDVSTTLNFLNVGILADVTTFRDRSKSQKIVGLFDR